MPSSINRVVLVGNLTRDPELRELSSGASVCHLRLACNGRRRTEGGEWEEKPNFFDVSVFGPQGENVHRYLAKGRPVGIDGRLEWREWESADQQRRQAVSVVADTVQFLGSPGDNGDRQDETEDLLPMPASAGMDDVADDLTF